MQTLQPSPLSGTIPSSGIEMGLSWTSMDNDVMTLFPELSENTGWTNFDDVDAIFGPKYETLPTDDMLPSNPTVCHDENHHGLSGKMLLFDDSTILPLPSSRNHCARHTY